jgi:ribosomal protein L37E
MDFPTSLSKPRLRRTSNTFCRKCGGHASKYDDEKYENCISCKFEASKQIYNHISMMWIERRNRRKKIIIQQLNQITDKLTSYEIQLNNIIANYVF